MGPEGQGVISNSDIWSTKAQKSLRLTVEHRCTNDVIQLHCGRAGVCILLEKKAGSE